MKKLILKTPQVNESQVDLFMIILGVAVIGYALYLGGVFNGPGKIIDARDRFGKPSESPGNSPSGNGATEQ